MSKRRLPTDIEFLLESVMSETPDKVRFFADDVAKLKSKIQTHVTPGGLNWSRKDTVAFFVHDKAGVVPYIKARHQDMEAILKDAASIAFLNPNDFNNSYTSYVDEYGNLGFTKIEGKAPVGLFNLKDEINAGDPAITVRRYLRKYYQEYFRDLNIRGTEADTPDKIARATVVAGRVWTKQQIVSFWNDKEVAMVSAKLLFAFLKSLNVSRKNCIYQFLDHRGFFTYDELFSKSVDKGKLSPEETDALRKIQHIDPNAKAKLVSPEFKDAMLKKAGRGFDMAAAAGMAAPALEEETIKLKDLLGRHQ